jgi:hypothetical protein
MSQRTTIVGPSTGAAPTYLPKVEDLVQDGSFFFENCQVKVWKGKVSGVLGRTAGVGTHRG